MAQPAPANTARTLPGTSRRVKANTWVPSMKRRAGVSGWRIAPPDAARYGAPAPSLPRSKVIGPASASISSATAAAASPNSGATARSSGSIRREVVSPTISSARRPATFSNAEAVHSP